jgi:hypothetical protein
MAPQSTAVAAEMATTGPRGCRRSAGRTAPRPSLLPTSSSAPPDVMRCHAARSGGFGSRSRFDDAAEARVNERGGGGEPIADDGERVGPVGT